MTSSIITFSIYFLYCLFFFLTLSVRKGLTAVQNVLLSAISVLLTLLNNFCFALLRLMQYLFYLLHPFLSVSFLEFKNLFLSHDWLVISLEWRQVKLKNVFWRSLIKASFENLLKLQCWMICGFSWKFPLPLNTFCEKQITLFQLPVNFETVSAYLSWSMHLGCPVFL